jgi:hypothetical protein
MFVNLNFMHRVVLENEYKHINSLQKHNFIKIISQPGTCFDHLGGSSSGLSLKKRDLPSAHDLYIS